MADATFRPVARRTWARRVRRWTMYLMVGWLVLTVGTVLLFRFVDPPTSMFIMADRVAAMTGDESYPLRHQWVSWPDISGNVKIAVIAAEDQKFPDHHGFDFESIQDALEDRERGGPQRGASTISQQVAKNLFLWADSNWVRKGLEVYFTVLIEVCWSKQRILEVYLNMAEFGRGVFGVGAASGHFYDKAAASLTQEQAARLAAVLPSPKHYSVAKPGRYVQRRTKRIQKQMRRLGGTGFLQRLK